MTEVRAFVGHSFTKDDEQVVGSFLKYLSTLQRMISFSWVHAEPAEPTELAAKVIKLMEDRNLLIAICTKKQRSISPDELQATLLPRGYLKAPVEKFRWKTSDWIIQEIGLAIGMGLKMILLLEEKVEKPGGLQGNIEYIEFNRDHPEACFNKILEMISTLLPTLSAATVAAADPRASPPKEEVATQAIEADSDWWKPKPGWTQAQYDMMLGHLIARGDEPKLKELNDDYAKTEHFSKEGNAARWEARSAYFRLAFGSGGTIAQLRKVAAEHPNNSDVRGLLASGLGRLGEEAEAARTFEGAAEVAPTSSAKAQLLGQSARAFATANRHNDASRVFSRMRQLEPSQEVELHILRTLNEVAKHKNDAEVSIASLERIIELTPDDYEARFALGYEHSEKSRDNLALFHYTKIPIPERDGGTWNNIGVSRDQVGLVAQSVDAYIQAESDENTLAMSNLAAKYLKVGFLVEAKAKCEEAMKLKDPSTNVGRTWADSKALPDKENERLKTILADAAPISNFYRQFGHAMTLPQPTHLSEDWSAPEGTVKVKVEGDEFTAEGVYEVSGGLGIGLLAFSTTGLPLPPPPKYHVFYRGKLVGCAARGTVRRTSQDETPKTAASLLSLASDEPEILMFFTTDLGELKILERSKSTSARFYSLLRKTSPSALPLSAGA